MPQKKAITTTRIVRTYVESTKEKLDPQIANFYIIFLTYAVLLGVDATDMVNLNKGSVFLTFILGMQAKHWQPLLLPTKIRKLEQHNLCGDERKRVREF